MNFRGAALDKELQIGFKADVCARKSCKSCVQVKREILQDMISKWPTKLMKLLNKIYEVMNKILKHKCMYAGYRYADIHNVFEIKTKYHRLRCFLVLLEYR